MPTAPPTVDYAELLAQLQATPGDVTDDQLADAEQALTGRLNELRPAVNDGTLTEEQYEEVVRLGEQLEGVRNAAGERRQAAADRASRAQAVLDQVDDPAADTGDEGTGDGDGQPATPDGDAGDTPDAAADPDGADAAADQPEPVAAGAARRPAPGSIGRGEPTARPRAQAGARIALTAAADVAGFAAGQTLRPEDIGRAMANRLRSIKGVRGGNGELINVMTFTAEIPDDRRLRAGRLTENTALLDRIAGPQAIVAAGGVCAPFAIDYSINVLGDTDEPIKDALPTVGAERGGVQFRRDIDAGGAGPVSATGVWTLEDDAAVGTGTPPDPKPVWKVPCLEPVSAELEAYTLQLEFSNITSRFDPETTQANTTAALIAHARFCENRRLAKLLAGSKQLTVADQISATVDLLVALDKTQAYFRYRRRLNAKQRLRMILPQWVRDMIRADLTRGMRTASLEALAVADATVDQWFANRNVNITWHLDGLPESTTPSVVAQQYADAAAGTAVPGFPDQVDAVLYAEGTWVRLDGGTLDIGLVRDSTLIEQNLYRQFSESFENLALKGIESLRITASLQPTGMSAGTLDTSALTD